MADDLSTEQQLAVIFETETAASLLGAGLRSLASRSAGNDELHLPLQVLSQGFERLLKLTWALGTLRGTGRLPSRDDVRAVGHDLLRLEANVRTLGRECGEFYRRPLIAQEDGFLADDSVLRAMLEALSNFAGVARYRDLDLLLEPHGAPKTPDFRRQWSEVEWDVLRLHPHWMEKLAEPAFSEWYEVLAGELVTRLQRHLRFVCLMWTLGPLGPLGRQHSVPLSHFIHLRDEDLHRPPATS